MKLRLEEMWEDGGFGADLPSIYGLEIHSEMTDITFVAVHKDKQTLMMNRNRFFNTIFQVAGDQDLDSDKQVELIMQKLTRLKDRWGIEIASTEPGMFDRNQLTITEDGDVVFIGNQGYKVRVIGRVSQRF